MLRNIDGTIHPKTSFKNFDIQYDGDNRSEMVRRSLKRLLLVTILVLPTTLLALSFILTLDADEISERNAQTHCRDWHDYEFIAYEKKREGPGEQGLAVTLTDPLELELNEKLYNQTGYSVVISDKISVNRSISDNRSERCKTLKYLSQLPKVSVIIIFTNEVKSVLLRTVHSVINRTPPELLHEIILVNDNSTNSELYEPLQKYMRSNFNGKVKIKNLNGRRGLIVTRLEGARIATGEVLVFFDSHIEVGTNWLPPLLDPIARNRRIATVPIIDDFAAESFEVFANGYEHGSRGGFDWMLIYKHFPRYLPKGVDPLKPFPTPIMLGCAFAIDRKFFLEELGGYDEGFEIWNGENYELSFKLWLCADGLFEVPCSRVTHTFRMFNPSRVRKDDYVGRNFKRLAEVWLDEYKGVVYGWDPNRYIKIDPGDLTKQKKLREKLACKPFSYFLEEVAPDFLARYPATKEQPVFASGQIRSLANNYSCVDNFHRSEFDPIGLFYCQKLDSSGMPPQSQFFRLSFNKNIVFGHMEYCLDSYKMSLPACSYYPYGNQFWSYDYVRKLLINGGDRSNRCLTGNFNNQTLALANCNENDENQKWTFSYVNETAIDNWDYISGYHEFVYGGKDVDFSKMLPLEYESCEI